MQSKDAERQEARRLRAEGWSITRIARELSVAKSSVSVWVRDLPKPPRPPKPPPKRPPQVEPSRPPVDGELSRYCSSCDRILALTCFNKLRDGHQHWCRECFSAYFRARGEVHRRQVRETTARRKAAVREALRARFAAEACADCGEDEILVLELDHHRGGKTRSLAQMLASATSMAKVERELRLCEVVCVNCHRRRTARALESFRATGIPRRQWTPSMLRKHLHVREHLAGHPCVDCGEGDVIVLDFDHVRGEKRAGIGSLLAGGCSLATLQNEIAKCDVRCANCHRIRTFSTTPCWRDESPDFYESPMSTEPAPDAPGRT